VPFRSVTTNVVQPNLFFPDAVGVNINLSSNVSKSERVADDPYYCVSESIITHGSPGAIMIHFKTPFAWTSASKQCNCTFCKARDSLVFTGRRAATHAPAVVHAVINVDFCSIAPHCIQPSLPRTKTVVVSNWSADVSETKNAANDSCCSFCPLVVIYTSGSPDAAVQHLKSSFAWIAASIQSDIYTITRDGDVFTMLTVVNAPAAV